VFNIAQDNIDRPARVQTEYEGLPCLGSDDVRGYSTYNPTCEVSYQVQLGFKAYPVMEIKTSQELQNYWSA
jgi:hypothetical protein